MDTVSPATSSPPLCRPHGQHGQKCEAQHGSWTRTKKQREARLWSRPRITGRSAEQRAIVDGASACGEPEAMQRAEGGAWHRQGKGFLFFLLIHITGGSFQVRLGLGAPQLCAESAQVGCV